MHFFVQLNCQTVSKRKAALPPGLFLAGRVSEPAYKRGFEPPAGSSQDHLQPVDEHRARLNGDLQALLRINSQPRKVRQRLRRIITL